MSKTLKAVFGNSLIQFSLFLLFVSTINFFGISPLTVILIGVLLAPLGIGFFWYRRQQQPEEEQARTQGMTLFFVVIWLVFVVGLFLRWPR